VTATSTISLVSAAKGAAPVLIASLTTTEIASLSATDVASFTPSDLASLSRWQVHAFSNVQIEAISPLTLSHLSSTFGNFNIRQVASLTTSQIASLTKSEVSTLTIAKLAAMSTQQIGAIGSDAFGTLGALRVASLTTDQVASLTSDQVLTLGTGKLAAMSADQIAALNPTDLANLGAVRIGSLNSDQVDALTSAQISALTDAESLALVNPHKVTAEQIAGMSANQLNILGGRVLSQFSPTLLNWDQIAGLNGKTISNLSTGFFSQIPTSLLAAIAPTAIEGISVSQLQSLTTEQLDSFSSKQMSTMSVPQTDVLSQANPFIVQAGLLDATGSLNYDGLLKILQGAASTDMTQAKFDQLQALAGKVQGYNEAIWGVSPGSIVLYEQFAQLFHNVVQPNAENTSWNGGGTQISQLGNLTSTSTQSQFDSLINKWFLGSDLPSLQVDAAGDVSSAVYEKSTLPLYGVSGAPTMSDVRMGGLSDSALLASVAETALQDPGYIQHLIANNGNGTYTVELPNLWGNSNFVTVNSELPVSKDGTGMAVANAATGSWVSLLEKAAAQNAVNTSIANGETPSTTGNSYAALTANSNSDDELTQYSGEYLYSQSLNYSQSIINQDLTSANHSFQAGQNVLLQSGDNFYAVTGIDATKGIVNVYDVGSGNTSSISITPKNDDVIYYGINAGGRTV